MLRSKLELALNLHFESGEYSRDHQPPDLRLEHDVPVSLGDL